ncbi:MAG TPA: M42 family peptidase, partial [Bacillota bacterium]|nr:M42 family peptidase [Bacillota bacterium]
PNAETAPDVNRKVFGKIRKVASDYGINLQVSVSGRPGGTDAFPMQTTGVGVATAILGVPIRYMHTSVETLELEDVKKCGRLMAYFCASVDKEFKEGLTCCLKS